MGDLGPASPVNVLGLRVPARIRTGALQLNVRTWVDQAQARCPNFRPRYPEGHVMAVGEDTLPRKYPASQARDSRACHPHILAFLIPKIATRDICSRAPSGSLNLLSTLLGPKNPADYLAFLGPSLK